MIDVQTRNPAAPVKVPPHSLEAEQAVLGALLLVNDAWDQIASVLQPVDFYRREHQIAFTAIAELAQKDRPFDVLSLADFLKQRNELEKAGGELYLFELASGTPAASNLNAYAGIVLERSLKRQLIGTAHYIGQLVYNSKGQTGNELLDEAERAIFAIGQKQTRRVGPEAINEILSKTTERIQELYESKGHLTGAPTGFSDLDDITSGLQSGDLIVVAGRPSMGKTCLGMNFAEQTAIKLKKPVLIFSMEMSSEQIAMRMMSSLGRIEQHRVRTGKLRDEDWPRMSSAINMLSESPIFIDDTPSMSPHEVRARARRVARECGSLGLIVVDYLQLMQVPGARENRTYEVSEISRSLKGLAKELNVPVIALSQLNRGLEQRQDRRPVMSDLRESGAIEQDADVIAFIYRDEVYNDDSPDKGCAEIIIAKQRNGPTGKVKLTFLGQYTRFENFVQESYVSEGM